MSFKLLALFGLVLSLNVHAEGEEYFRADTLGDKEVRYALDDLARGAKIDGLLLTQNPNTPWVKYSSLPGIMLAAGRGERFCQYIKMFDRVERFHYGQAYSIKPFLDNPEMDCKNEVVEKALSKHSYNFFDCLGASTKIEIQGRFPRALGAYVVKSCLELAASKFEDIGENASKHWSNFYGLHAFQADNWEDFTGNRAVFANTKLEYSCKYWGMSCTCNEVDTSTLGTVFKRPLPYAYCKSGQLPEGTHGGRALFLQTPRFEDMHIDTTQTVIIKDLGPIDPLN